MGEVSTIGLDIAKSVFQVHGVSSDGEVMIRKRVSRVKDRSFSPVCHRAWLALRRARPLIIGAGSFTRSATR